MNMQQMNESQKSRELTAILALLKENKCDHCDYFNVLDRLNTTLAIHPDNFLTDEEKEQLLNLNCQMLIEEKKDHRNLNEECAKCRFGPKHKSAIKKALRDILKALDEALQIPTLTYGAFFKRFST